MNSRLRNLLVLWVPLLLWQFFGEPLWVRNWEYYLDKRDWDKAFDAVVAAMPDWINAAVAWLDLGGFWGGAFSMLAVWSCFEAAYAVRRRRRADASEMKSVAELAEDERLRSKAAPGDTPAPAGPNGGGEHRGATLDFAGRSNAALKELAFQVGRELRVFEARYLGEGARILRQTDASQSEGGRDYHRQVVGAEYNEHKQQADAHWRIHLHPRAQAVRHELRRRLSEFSARGSDHRGSAIEDGSLAGNRALTAAAGYLEDLARRLPD